MVYSLWAYILMGVYGDIPGAGLTALLQKPRRIKKMTDKKKTTDLEILTNSDAGNETVTLQEINFDAWDADNVLVSGGHDWHSGTTDTITITTDTPLSSFGTDVITVTQDDLRELKTSSNGINQGDLFNGWPEDGDPVTVTVNKNYDDE